MRPGPDIQGPDVFYLKKGVNTLRCLKILLSLRAITAHHARSIILANVCQT